MEYLLDTLQPYELAAILDNIEYSVKVSWEQARFQSYIQANSFASKPIKLTDILSFGWEESKDTSITNSDIERLKNKAQTILNNKNGRFSNQT